MRGVARNKRKAGFEGLEGVRVLYPAATRQGPESKKAKLASLAFCLANKGLPAEFWSGRRESNPRL
jgi:hypothetical protein